MVDDAAMNELSAICPGAKEMAEGGINYIHLPQLKVAGAEIIEGLLCIQQHGGYTTRLFLSQPIAGKGANWSVHQILGKTWHTWSWNNVPGNLRPAEILAGHLRAFR